MFYLELLWVFSILIFINTYLFYPFLMIFILNRKSQSQIDYEISVTVVISALNEEKHIFARIQNIIEQNYPQDKIQIIVGSDNSRDNTNKILSELSEKYKNLKTVFFNERQGKAAVINNLIPMAENEIIIFTDANTEFDKDAIKNLVRHFKKESVGGVSGRLILTDENVCKTESVEEKKYWEVETKIKISEGARGILLGANGGIFAIRKNLFTEVPIKKAVTDDLFISLEVLKKGKEFVYEELAKAYETVGNTVKQEFKRKVRFAATNFQTLIFMKDLIFTNRLFVSYAFLSHKVFRWFAPFLLMIIFIVNYFLLPLLEIYKIAFYLQIIFYIMSLVGLLFWIMKIRIKVFSLPFFFCMANYALVLGFLKFLINKHSTVWNRTER